jgi:small-conductance mechanosensitive channel
MNAVEAMQRMLRELTLEHAAVELAALAAALALAYGLLWLLRGRERPAHSLWFGERLFDGVLFPLFAVLASVAARWLLGQIMPVLLLKIAPAIFLGLLLIRLSAQGLRMAFPRSTAVRRIERSVSWLVWIGLVLWFTGVLPLVNEELDSVHWRVAGVNLSLLTLIEGAVTAGGVLLLMLWLSATIESQLLKGAAGADLSARKIAVNAIRAALLLVGLLMALSAAGIPLSALSVFGGAAGVGIGLGLQRLAANYVSGFVILAERSLRIGDLVKVDTFEGHITDIKTRYTVIRALTGRESIVPNEMLLTQRVENSSLADRKVLVSTAVQVAYGTDLNTLMPALLAAVSAVPRVMPDPGPGVLLSSFAADGLELTVNFWIVDPENGQGNVRSAVNLALLAALDAAGVEIPFPQRVLRMTAAGAAAVPAVGSERPPA